MKIPFEGLKISFLCKISCVFLCLQVSAAFMSCSFFNEPVKEYLKEYAESAAIVRHYFDDSYPVDSEGYVSIPSGADHTVFFVLRNPKEYLLDFTPVLSAEAVEKSMFRSDLVKMEQSNDRSFAQMTFSNELLSLMERGGDLSTVIKFTERKTSMVFRPYQVKLRVNSAPLPVRNLSVLKDPTGSNGGTYILCFNMPDLNGIHSDICLMDINGKKFKVSQPDVESGTGLSDLSILESESDKWTTVLEGGEYFEGSDESRSVYYKTGITLGDLNYKFTVTLIDKKGLSTSTSISALSEKLKPVTIVSKQGPLKVSDSIVPDESGYAGITITAPVSMPDASVHWLLNSDNIERSETGSVLLKLVGRRYNINAWAHKDGYIDSSVIALTGIKVVSPRYYYVSRDGRRDNPGTADLPFETVQNAIDAIIRRSTDEEVLYTICLLSDITAPNIYENFNNAMIDVSDGENGNRLNLKICSYTGRKTIDAECNAIKNRRVIYIGRNTHVTLENIKLTGGCIDNAAGAGVYLGGGSLALRGTVDITENKAKNVVSNLYINGRSKIYITGPLTGSKIGITLNTSGGTESPVEFTDGYDKYNHGIDPSEYFISDNGYKIGISEKGEVQIQF